MAHTIYYKLVRYFIGLMCLTCAITCALFFATAGRSMIEDMHKVIRTQVTYIAGEAQEKLNNGRQADRHGPVPGNLSRFIDRTASTFGVRLALYDRHGHRLTDPSSELPQMLDRNAMIQVQTKGEFVRPGHFSGTTVYILPINSPNKDMHFLYFQRDSKIPKSLGWLLAGLGLMLVFLILAIYPLARSFTRPIDQLSRGLSRMAQGELDLVDETFPNVNGRDGDELTRLVHVFREMSRSVNEMMASKKRFLADISHELRSPLGRMEVSLELLREETHEKEAKRYISTMDSEIRFMTEMIRSLSAYAKINLSDYKLAKVPITPAQIIQKTTDRYADMVHRQGISLSARLNEQLPEILVDQAQIIRVMNNLMDNAITYCNPLGTIGIEARQVGGWICFCVWDTGPGVTGPAIEKIFDPLFRTDPSRNRNTGGLGLGLAICKKILDLHRGRIEYIRENGKSYFRFYLPQEDRRAQQ